MCESEPAKGYVYDHDVAYLINGTDYKEEVLSFINRQRDYVLRLYKESEDHKILLDGAKFVLTYEDEGKQKEVLFVTGALNIQRKDNKTYVIYRHEGESKIYTDKFSGNEFIKNNVEAGRWYYYLSDDETIDESKLEHNYVNVIKGAYEIRDIPYSATLHLKELEAPKGYFISEADFDIRADIPYSEIIFNNTRINQFDIIPENRHPLPKTCIGERSS